jgi:hypothetical protein
MERLAQAVGRWLLTFIFGYLLYLMLAVVTLCTGCEPYWSTLGAWYWVLDVLLYAYLAVMFFALALILVSNAHRWLQERADGRGEPPVRPY